jgi:hypothetical protein
VASLAAEGLPFSHRWDFVLSAGTKGGAVGDKEEWEERGTQEGSTGEVAVGAGQPLAMGCGRGCVAGEGGGVGSHPHQSSLPKR